MRSFNNEFPFITKCPKYYCSKHDCYFNLLHPVVLENISNNCIILLNNEPEKLLCFDRTIIVIII